MPKKYILALELKFLLIKAQIDLKSIFLALKSSINSIKTPIKSINLQIWAFLLKIKFFFSTGLSSLRNILSKIHLYIFNILDQFSDHFLSTSAFYYYYYYYFILFLFLIFLAIYFIFVEIRKWVTTMST